MSGVERGKRLLALALHEGTPEHERAAAALALCRIVKKLDILVEREATVVVDTPQPKKPEEEDRVLGSTNLGDGWRWVETARSRFCSPCERKTVRRSSLIPSGSKAAERKGHYQHEDCHKKWGG